MTPRKTAQRTVYALIDQPRPSGLVRQLLCALARLDGEGWHPELICIVREAEQAERLREAARAYGVHCTVLRERHAFDPGPLRKLLVLAGHRRPALIQTHGYKPSVYGLVLRLRYRIPWIAFYHGRTATDWRVRLYHALDSALISFASSIVTVAPGVERHLAPWNRGGVVVIPNGVVQLAPPEKSRQAVRAEYGIEPTAPMICLIGRLSYEKAPDVFLEALAQSEIPGAQALIAGEGPMRAEAERRARELNIEDRVHFAGHVEDVAALYSAAELIVISSRSEVFPNVLLEAVDAGVPVASTTVGGIPTVARGIETVVTCEPEAPEELADAMRRALRLATPDRLDRARRQVRARYSQVRRAESLRALYEDVVSR